MSTITLFEHERCAYLDLGWDSAHPAISQIERLNEAAGAELLRLGRKYVQATHFVGVIRAGEVTVQVLPKIDYDPIGDASADGESIPFQRAADSATRNLLHLLSYTQDLLIKEQDLAPLLRRRSSWFELLTYLLAMELQRQMRQGLQRDYVVREDTLPVMRGRWQLERQLTRHPHVRHRFDVIYDEFSPDTALNRVFGFVVQRLIFHSQDPGNRRLLRHVSKWLVDVERMGEVPQACLEAVRFTRLSERFQPAFNLARLFLQNETFQLTAGKEQNFAFVFDMNRLFEEFVYRFMVKHRRDILGSGWEGLHIRYQARGKPVYLAERLPAGTRVFRLKPDILLERPSGRTVLVLDTKYKGLDNAQRRLGIADEDMYQMLAYAVALDCPRTLLLYPQRAGSGPTSAHFETLGHRHSVVAATINLRQPLDRPGDLIQELRQTLTEVLAHDPLG